jgi:predicted NUDIX family phosphoesterase
MHKDDEKVLCVERSHLEQVKGGTLFQGYDPVAKPWLEKLCDIPLHWLRRGDCEEDESFKQLIPYCTVMHRWHDFEPVSVLRYNHTKTSGEDRLLGKAAIGIGGHINPDDKDGGNAFGGRMLERAFLRELLEEINWGGTEQHRVVGMINDDSDAVGRVHFGIHVQVQVDIPAVWPNEPSLDRMYFQPLDMLTTLPGFEELQDEFETWSKIILKAGSRALYI